MTSVDLLEAKAASVRSLMARSFESQTVQAQSLQAGSVGAQTVQAGSIAAKVVSGVEYADQFPGPGGGDKIEQAVAALAGTPGTVFVPGGSYVVGTDVTVPASVTLEVSSGADIKVAAGRSFIVRGYLAAGRYPITSGDGDFLVEGPNRFVFPEWYGALPGVGDVTSQMQRAYRDAEKSGRGVSLAGGSYSVCNLQLGDPATAAHAGQTTQAPGVSTFGAGEGYTNFVAASGCTGWVVQRNNTAFGQFENFDVDGGQTAKGIDLSWVAGAPATNDTVGNIRVTNFVRYGIFLDGLNDAKISNIAVAAQNSVPNTVGFHLVGVNGMQYLSAIKVYDNRAVIGGQNQACVECYFQAGLEVSNYGLAFTLVGSQVQAPNGEAAITFSGGNPSAYSFSMLGSAVTLGTGSSVFGSAPDSRGLAAVGDFMMIGSDVLLRPGASGASLYASGTMPAGRPINVEVVGGWIQIGLPASNSVAAVSYGGGSGGLLPPAAVSPLTGSVAGSTAVLAKGTCGDTVSVSVPGARTSMAAVAAGEGSLPTAGLLLRAAVTGAGAVAVEYCNLTDSAIKPAPLTIAVTVVR